MSAGRALAVGKGVEDSLIETQGSEAIDRLRGEWLARLEQLNARCRGFPATGMDCLNNCSGLCCPQVRMRGMALDAIASPIVVFLPFEMEYMIERHGVAEDAFRRWPVEMEPGVVIDVGMFDLGKPCPFLKPDCACGIYSDRPVDCQTFPLLPLLDAAGQMVWSYGQECPCRPAFHPAYDDQVRAMWADLNQALPRAWWDLYRAADDWLGWPPEDEHGA